MSALCKHYSVGQSKHHVHRDNSGHSYTTTLIVSMDPSQFKEVTELPETASVEDTEAGRIRKLTEKGLEAYTE